MSLCNTPNHDLRSIGLTDPFWTTSTQWCVWIPVWMSEWKAFVKAFHSQLITTALVVIVIFNFSGKKAVVFTLHPSDNIHSILFSNQIKKGRRDLQCSIALPHSHISLGKSEVHEKLRRPTRKHASFLCSCFPAESHAPCVSRKELAGSHSLELRAAS